MTGPISPTLPAHDQAAWDVALNAALTTMVNRMNTHADQHAAGQGDPIAPSDIGAVATATTAAATSTVVLAVKLASDLLARTGHLADGTIQAGEPPLTISTVAGTATVTVTTSASHGYGTGDVVTIAGVGGITGVNGVKTITRVAPTQFTLNSTTGSGSYTSGGSVQRLLGGTGAITEGFWNLLLPDTSRDGLVIRGREGSTTNLILTRDYKGAPVWVVGQVGGAGLISAAPADALYVNPTVFTRCFAATAGGGIRGAAGDPAGGVDVLALGNSTTPPTGVPDGSHLGEGSYGTSEGTVVWSRNGRPRARTSLGHEDDLLVPINRRVQSVAAPGGDTVLLLTGVQPPTVATTNITPSVDDQAEGPLVTWTTTAATSVDAGLISTFGGIQPRWAPAFYARIRTDASAITSTRIAVGLVSADVATNAGPSSSGAYTVAAGAWFRYSTTADGTAAWRTVTGDGTTATVTTTAASIASDTSYELLVELNAAASIARFSVNGVLVATHTTNLPAASTALGYTARLRTLASSARALRFGRLTWSQL